MADVSEDMEIKRIPGVNFVVGIDRLNKIDINSILPESENVDYHEISQIFHGHAEGLSAHESEPFHLIVNLTSFVIVPDHRAEPFKPLLRMNGERTLVPSDLVSEQIDVLAEIVPTIANARLRAHITDVVWFLQRHRQDIASLAIESYCDCIELINRNATDAERDSDSFANVKVIEFLTRAAQISSMTQWGTPASDKLRSLISAMESKAFYDRNAEEYCRIVMIDIEHDVSSITDIATRAEDLANMDKFSKHPDQRIDLWEIAACCHKKNKDHANHDRCMIEVAERHVEKARSEKSEAISAQCLHKAIEILRNFENTRARRDELEKELRRIQPRILDEMGVISTTVDVTEAVKHSLDSVRGRSWFEAFLYLIRCDRPPGLDQLRDEIDKILEINPFIGDAPAEVHDYQGRLIFCSSGLLDEDTAKQEKHRRFLISRHLREPGRKIVVSCAINPIRHTIVQEHSISVDVILRMFQYSPFVPPGRHYIFARSIVQFLAGEDVEALSVLVPQLENSLRHILELNDIDTTAIDSRGIQTEASLSVLLNQDKPWRGKLEEVIPSQYINEIDLLFNFPGGPSLRNQVSHGKVSAIEFSTHDAVYAIWLIIQLAALPVMQQWGIDLE